MGMIERNRQEKFRELLLYNPKTEIIPAVSADFAFEQTDIYKSGNIGAAEVVWYVDGYSGRHFRHDTTEDISDVVGDVLGYGWIDWERVERQYEELPWRPAIMVYIAPD